MEFPTTTNLCAWSTALKAYFKVSAGFPRLLLQLVFTRDWAFREREKRIKGMNESKNNFFIQIV